ncbi:MAG: rRNA adenine N-6-methyltransferase family protein [Oscillospiraceae bacterium]
MLEVGPGIGCLTEQLAQRAAKVVSVELDERLRPVLAETLAGYENVELVFGDVLALDLPQLVAEALPRPAPRRCARTCRITSRRRCSRRFSPPGASTPSPS